MVPVKIQFDAKEYVQLKGAHFFNLYDLKYQQGSSVLNLNTGICL